MNSKAIFNRAPLPHSRFAPLPLTAIRPEGWLKEQLKTQAEGLSGNLYKFWPYVSDDTAWLGGEGDAWERAPYYIDGLLPLAYLTGDEKLLERVKRHVEWILGSQREDGWFGPEMNEDWWPRMVVLKILIQYYTATTDNRVIEFMLKYFRYEYLNLRKKPFKEWAVARGGENIMCALWLYNLTGAAFLLKLCNLIERQTLDWGRFFTTFPYTRSMAVHIPNKEAVSGMADEPALTGEDRPYYRTQYHYSHVVNVAMGLKTPALNYLLHGGKKDRATFYDAWQKLTKYHGVANGMFTGDEHLSGNSPTQGTELCAVVESMYSLEKLTWMLSDLSMGDILEKIAFNALPATISRDMNTHQYDQQANQVRCSDEPRPWYNNNSDSNTFGLEPNFGCCTANMHQGWPKYAASLWMATDDGGLAALSYSPCTVRFIAGGQQVRLNVETEYPFEECVRIRVSVKEKCKFPIYMRVPGWCEGFEAKCGDITAEVSDGMAVIEREWSTGDAIEIRLPMSARLTRWYHQSGAVEYGPLLMALPIAEDWRVTNERGAFSDYEVWPKDDNWNYALIGEQDFGALRAERTDAAPGFIGETPLKLSVKAVRAPEWTMKDNNCGDPSIGLDAEGRDIEDITLTPYGASRLHVSQLPVC